MYCWASAWRRKAFRPYSRQRRASDRHTRDQVNSFLDRTRSQAATRYDAALGADCIEAQLRIKALVLEQIAATAYRINDFTAAKTFGQRALELRQTIANLLSQVDALQERVFALEERGAGRKWGMILSDK